jgi:hypothetical protein
MLCEKCLNQFNEEKHSKCPVCGIHYKFLPGEKSALLIMKHIKRELPKFIIINGNYPNFYLFSGHKILCELQYTENSIIVKNLASRTDTEFEFANPNFELTSLFRTITDVFTGVLK